MAILTDDSGNSLVDENGVTLTDELVDAPAVIVPMFWLRIHAVLALFILLL